MRRLEVMCTPIPVPIRVAHPSGFGYVDCAWPAPESAPYSTGAWAAMCSKLSACLGTDYTVTVADGGIMVERVDGTAFDLQMLDSDLADYFGLQASYGAVLGFAGGTPEGLWVDDLGGEVELESRCIVQRARTHAGSVRSYGYGVQRLWTPSFVVPYTSALQFAAVVARLQAGELGTLVLGPPPWDTPTAVALSTPGGEVDLAQWIAQDSMVQRRVSLPLIQIRGIY
jgi:hypothetical protein